MEIGQQSIFMQMHNGARTGEGSFHIGLQKLFYLADKANKHKLVAAFPEFFGEEVPEFGIYKTLPQYPVHRYEGCLCIRYRASLKGLLYAPHGASTNSVEQKIQHIAERHSEKGSCVACIRTYLQILTSANGERIADSYLSCLRRQGCQSTSK